MGHGKETPRQKMIGMMYLVLTALLALNVSAEVLNAFILVNKSLVKTIDNTTIKNEGIYKDFQNAYDQNPTKAKQWYDKAQTIKSLAQEINDTILSYKRMIVQIADKVPEDQWNDSLFNHVQAKSDNNVPGQVMILWKNGERLKEKIENFRGTLISLLDTTKSTDASFVENIRSTFNTDDVIGNEGRPVDWAHSYFDQLPLMGVITILSKLQTDVRNTEADFISYFYGQISAKDWKFNKIQAFVDAKKSYVLKDGRYEANVFIAASDTTVTPKIVLSSGQALNVVDGQGKYVGSTSTTGTKRWKGVIKYPSPTGAIIDFPFDAEYEVGEPSLTVSPTKMNVFYIGVKNPVEISASGVPNEKIKATISNGSLSRDGNAWAVKVNKGKEAWITASAEIDGKTKALGKKKFRVKRVPDPVAKVGSDPQNERGGIIRKSALLAQAGVKADLENFDFDLKFVVTEFSVSVSIAGYEEEARSKSAKFTPKQKQLMQKVKPGKKIYIENIVAVGPDKVPRKLGSIVFKVM